MYIYIYYLREFLFFILHSVEYKKYKMARQVLRSLDILQEYPAISEYIKEFNGTHGFMYTRETDPVKIALNVKMEELLDDGSHSGASWGYMMRYIQAVLQGNITLAEVQEKAAEEQAEENLWVAERNRLREAEMAVAQTEGVVQTEGVLQTVQTEGVQNDNE